VINVPNEWAMMASNGPSLCKMRSMLGVISRMLVILPSIRHGQVGRMPRGGTQQTTMGHNPSFALVRRPAVHQQDSRTAFAPGSHRQLAFIKRHPVILSPLDDLAFERLYLILWWGEKGPINLLYYPGCLVAIDSKTIIVHLFLSKREVLADRKPINATKYIIIASWGYIGLNIYHTEFILWCAS